MADDPEPPAPSRPNAARCRLCGTIIESKHHHDSVTCRCGAIAIDNDSDHLAPGATPDTIERVELP